MSKRVVRRSGVKLWTPSAAAAEDTGSASQHQSRTDHDDLDALLDMYTQQAQAETQQVQQRVKQQQRPSGRQGEAQARTEGLEKPIDADNKGFQLLAKMGYKAGMGLGRQEQGPVAPLDIRVRTQRAGLGVDEAKRQRQQQQEQLALQQVAKRAWQLEQQHAAYREAAAGSFQQRRWWGALRKAVRAAEQLDERAGRESNPLLERATAACFPQEPEAAAEAAGNKEAGDAGEDAAVEGEMKEKQEEQQGQAEQQQQVGVKELLDALLLYLREQHCYCLFCGCKYEGPDDLADNCPGVYEEDH